MTRVARNRLSTRQATTIAAVVVAFGAATFAWSSRAAEGLPMPVPDEWLTASTTSTTTTTIADPLDAVATAIDDVVDGTPLGPSSTTTTTTAPTDTPSSTTTTTAPASTPPDPPRAGQGSEVRQRPSETAPLRVGGGAAAKYGKGASAAIAQTVPAVSEAPAGIGDAVPSRPTRSIVMRDAPAVAAAQSLPGGRTTSTILDGLAGLDLAPTIVAQVLAPFPVAGKASYSDTWGALRLEPFVHRHEGTDIFASFGTPVIASADGTVNQLVTDGPVGGTALRVTTMRGTYFYYAHLDRFAPTLYEGKEVDKGDVLGFVGVTGNADDAAPHLHYEIHPAGGAPVNPVPYLDRWLAEAALAAASVRGAPMAAAEVLAAQPRTEVGAIRSARRLRPQARATSASANRQLGDVQPISYVAVAPGGVIVAGCGAFMTIGRTRRARQAKRLARR